MIKYSQETGWAIDKVRNSLIQLQSFALNRVSENKVYQDTGVATIFVNCVKPETTTLDPNDNKVSIANKTLRYLILIIPNALLFRKSKFCYRYKEYVFEKLLAKRLHCLQNNLN